MSVELANRNLESTVDWFMPVCPEAEARPAVTPPAQFSTAFRVEWCEETLVVTAERGYQQLGERELGNQVNRLLQLLDSHVSGVVIDLGRTNDCPTDRLLGPTAAFWNRLGKRAGRLALCGLCEHGRQTLERTRLDAVWQVCSTREEVIAQVNKESAERGSAETVCFVPTPARRWREWGRSILSAITN